MFADPQHFIWAQGNTVPFSIVVAMAFSMGIGVKAVIVLVPMLLAQSTTVDSLRALLAFLWGFPMVLPMFSLRLAKFQIRGSVVGTHAVFVMHNLMALEESTKPFLHHQPMFHNVRRAPSVRVSGRVNHNVPRGDTYSSTAPATMCVRCRPKPLPVALATGLVVIPNKFSASAFVHPQKGASILLASPIEKVENLGHEKATYSIDHRCRVRQCRRAKATRLPEDANPPVETDEE